MSRTSFIGVMVYSSTEVTSDIIITGMLFWGLRNSKSGWEQTDRIVGRLMRLMMETQTPPAVL